MITRDVCLVWLLIVSIARAGLDDKAMNEAKSLRDRGEFEKATALLQSQIDQSSPPLVENERRAAEFEVERIRRIRQDYPAKRESVLKKITDQAPGFTEAEFDEIEKAGKFDIMVIDGQKFYAGSSARNIFMRDFDLRKRRKKESKPDTTCQRLYAHMLRVKEAQKLSRDTLLLPQDFMTTYILTVKKDAVPEGKTIRCWLPYVRAYPFLSGATMIEADPPKYVLAPPEYPHRTVYMEKTAQKDADTRFMIRFIFRCWARANTINPADVQPYRKDAPDYQYYTAKHKPHNDLNNDLLKKLNAEIVGGETNPYTAARRIYDWMTKNLIYQFAREYSTLENISLYTASGRAGDCGQHSMLFMTLCRMNGIPARWQSGWEMFEAGGNNMHDWNEIYIEPFGWIPVDADMAINIALYSDDLLDTTQSKELADWMFGNMDHFRMAVNSDWGAPLYPPKNDFRSETVDFQRGEVEYDNHNLYFDKWSWDMDIQPITAEQAMELTRKIIPPPVTFPKPKTEPAPAAATTATATATTATATTATATATTATATTATATTAAATATTATATTATATATTATATATTATATATATATTATATTAAAKAPATATTATAAETSAPAPERPAPAPAKPASEPTTTPATAAAAPPPDEHGQARTKNEARRHDFPANKKRA